MCYPDEDLNYAPPHDDHERAHAGPGDPYPGDPYLGDPRQIVLPPEVARRALQHLNAQGSLRALERLLIDMGEPMSRRTLGRCMNDGRLAAMAAGTPPAREGVAA